MEQHVKILAILNIVLGGLGVLAALVVLVVFGGLAGLEAADTPTGAQGDAAVLGLIGGIVFIAITVLSIPSLIVGYGLLKFRSWAQILAIILSVLSLMNIPLGTVLGIYWLWVLLNNETKPLFRAA